ncbi:protein vreteno isoform X2 [Scaptodrosophila lebanonensis]|nr:protein vreteno isoform X2 [Scaptodrosophila lebanonensis]
MPSTESVLSDEELKALFGAMKCCDCELHTDNSCKYCGIPYCNAICFNAICDEHEKLCKNFAKLPELERVKNNMRCKIPKLQQLELPPSGSSVQITAFEQTNVVYIRSVDMHSSVAYIKILSTVMRKGKCAPKLKHLPQTGQIVIYKFDREIVRAMVLNVDDPQAIYLVCVDFGNIEITTLDSLYECSTDLAELPRYAIPVLLRGIPRRYMRPEVRNVLYQIHDTFSFVLKYNEREFDSNGGMQRVLLFEREMNLSLNRLMKTLLTPVEPSFDIPGLTEKFLNHVSLPTGKNKKLVIMSNFYCNIGLLYCTTLDFAYEITLMQRDMQVYGESEKAFTYFAPSRGELCIAKYYGKWYRGKCVNLVGNGYPSILFIDYGHITPIHINSIRRYPPQFDFPILTTEFDIVDQPNDLTDEMIARLKNHFLTGSIIEFDEVIFNEKQNNYSLRINDLFKILNGA